MSAISPFGHKTLLQLVQQACAELGIARPNAVASNQDMLVQQLLQCMRQSQRVIAAVAETELGGMVQRLLLLQRRDIDIQTILQRLLAVEQWQQGPCQA